MTWRTDPRNLTGDMGPRYRHFWQRNQGDPCKGDYQANLEAAGEKQNIGWTYAVTFSWGEQQQCPPSS